MSCCVLGNDSPADPPRRGRKPKSLGVSPKAGKQQIASSSGEPTGLALLLLPGQTSLKYPAEIISGNHASIQQDKQDAEVAQSSGTENALESISTSLPAVRPKGDGSGALAQREAEETSCQFPAVRPAPPRLAWKTMVRPAPAPAALKVGSSLHLFFTLAVC